jgi:DHA2 family multidrug resistance protein
VLGLLALTVLALVVFTRRTLARAYPVVRLGHLGDRNFAVGCLLSFVLGMGLFGSVYMMPVFLALVRGHGAFEIGEIMLVTGLAQLVTAPVAVALERRIDARLLAGAGFLVFGLGLALSANQTTDTDFHQMIVPQIVRGSAIMFCLLPPTRLALGDMPLADVPDGSGLFNLMRNLGGAIGLAMIDTVIYGRAPVHAKAITASLQNGDVATAKAVGIPIDLFVSHHGPIDDATRAILEPMVQSLALARAINDAWALVAAMTFCALLVLPFSRRPAVPTT